MTPDPKDAEPSAEAIAVAMECATEDGAGGLHLAMPGHQIRRVALAFDHFRREERQRAEDAVRACPSLDENGYICEKSAAIKAIQT